MFACMKKVDRLFVGPELFEKRPVVGRGVGDGNQFGPHLADVSDLFGELRLQRRLAGFRPKTERFQTIAFRVLETDRPAGRLAPACFFVPVGAERNHHPVERDSTGNGFAGFRLADAVHGLLLPFLPETARRFQQTLQVARRRVHASQLSEEFGRFPRRAMVQDQESAVCGRVREISVNQAHRRPARTSPCASGNTGPDRTAWVFCVRAARTLPSSRTGPPLSSRRTCTTRHNATTRLPDLEIGERAPPVWSLP